MCPGSFKRVCTLVVSGEQCWIPAVLVKTSQIEPWLHRYPYNQLLSAHPVTLVTFKVSCIGSDLHCLCKYSFGAILMKDKMSSSQNVLKVMFTEQIETKHTKKIKSDLICVFSQMEILNTHSFD